MRTLLIVVTLLFLGVSAQAQTINADTVLTLVQQRFSAAQQSGAIHDFSADFYQKAYIASLGRTRTGRGTITMRFDHQDQDDAKTLLRWIYQVPSTQQIVSNGDSLWVYLPDNNQVMVSELDDSLDQSNDPMLFLRNLGRLDHYFTPRLISQENADSEDYLLELTPKQPSAYIQTLTLTIPAWITAEQPPLALPLRRAAILDQTGNQTEIEFRHVVLNQSPEDALFTFELPEKVEIIKASDLKLNLK